MSSLVKVEKQGNFAILELNREPVNSFSLDFFQEINAELDKVETDQDCKGLIVTSVGLFGQGWVLNARLNKMIKIIAAA